MWEELQKYLEDQANKEGFNLREPYETPFFQLLKIKLNKKVLVPNRNYL